MVRQTDFDWFDQTRRTSNAYIIFDHQSSTNFKFAGVNVGLDKIRCDDPACAPSQNLVADAPALEAAETAPALTPAELAPIVRAAKSRWIFSGLLDEAANESTFTADPATQTAGPLQ